MRHQLDFADSLRRPVTVCLGLTLRPYSIGMELELLRARSPFIFATTFAEIQAFSTLQRLESLVFAVDCCSQTEAERAESDRLLSGRFRWTDFRARRQQRRLNRIWSDWTRQIGRLTQLEQDLELEKFWGYLCTGKTGPEFAKSEGDTPGTPIGAPEMCSLLHYLRTLPPARLAEWGGELDFPIAVARYEYYSLLESQGKVMLKSDFAPQSLSDFAAEQDAKVANGEIDLESLIQKAEVAHKAQEEPCHP